MARIRTVKPEFWQNETLAELSAMTRLLAIGLLNHADDEGYFRANPALVRAAIFPFDDSANVPGMLQELSRAGYLRLAQGSDGKTYGWVVTFLKHQRVDKPKPSEIKGLCVFQDDSKMIPGIIQDESMLERKGKEQGTGNREAGSGEPDAATAASSRSQPLVTLQGYIDRRKAEGQKPIPKEHAVFEYAEAAGIPENFLTLAWHEFRGRYTTSPDDRKKYRDWPGVFLKAVKGNWMKVWYVEAGAYKLTTVGQQAELVRGNNVH
jgi:hypothetical protein